ncbi:MAG: ribosomal RNA small subunit methyltransferase A [Desulfobacteraceae bacterium]|nr:MAG: ribosomal RNA small subunit methyltransferase A [Desulfobacteraceae bacterium]
MTSPNSLARQFDIKFKKQLGQNFLSDPSTANMIVERSRITGEDTVLEIGPGFGALTIPAAAIAKRLIAVEKDHRVIPVLKNELQANHLDNVTILNESILSVDLLSLAEKANGKLLVIGNLPYNISSQILIQLMSSRSVISRAVLMFQKELAQRIISSESCKDYGRLSVMIQYLADIRSIAKIKAHLFTPKPKIDSEVIEITFKPEIQNPATDESFLFQVIKAGFGKRRKNLKNALSASELEIDTETAITGLMQAGIDPNRRAETLTVPEFVMLSNCLYPLVRHC